MGNSYLAEAGTFSKSTAMWGLPYNTYATDGKDCYVRLNDGKWYLDWVSGLGAVILGQDREFQDYISTSIRRGTGFSLVHEVEFEVAALLAKMLTRYVPGWGNKDIEVRFCKTGSEATTMAMRLARALTRCPVIVTFSGMYHGWLDWAISRTDPAWGISPEERRFCKESTNWGNPKWYDEYFGLPVGGVIFEHPSTDVEDKDWYKSLRSYTTGYLIADEVVTGLRYGMGGACGHFGIEPDLVCMGKGLGNGFPIAAVAGPEDYLDWFARDDPVFCSSTHWGETASLYAAKYVLEHWNEHKVKHLWDIGQSLKDGIKGTGWDIFGHPPRTVMRFKDEKERAFFIKYMFEHGILMNRPNLPNLAHSEHHVAETVEVAKTGREEYLSMSPAQLDAYVEGRMPKVLFSGR